MKIYKVNMMKLKFRLKKKQIIWIALAVVIVAIVIWRIMIGKQPKVEYTTAPVTRGELAQTVSETGSVKPLQELALNFLATGKVAMVNVKVGDLVFKDQVLAELDLSDLQIKARETAAQSAVAQAQFDKILAGASGEDLAVSGAQLQSAQSAYAAAVAELENVKNSTESAVSQAEKNYQDLIQSGTLTTYEQTVNQAVANLTNAKKTYSQAINNQTANLSTALKSKLPVAMTALDAVDRVLSDNSLDNYLSVKNSSYLSKTNTSYTAGRADLAIANKSVLNLTESDITTVKADYGLSIKAITESFEATNYCFSALENSVTASGFTQASLDAFKASISAQITGVSSALTSLQASKQSLDDTLLAYDTNISNLENSVYQAQAALSDAKLRAENTMITSRLSRDQQITAASSRVDSASKALNLAKAQSAKVSAKARPEDIALARSQVMQAQAASELIKNQMNNNKIIAPLDAQVAEISYKVGEQAQPGQAAVKLIAKDGFEIELDVAETDIAKLKIGNKAVITLDAFGDGVKLEGVLASMEPAATVIQGVIYYKVKIDFLAGVYNIRPGMTATAAIIADTRADAIQLPIRAIQERKDGAKFVRILQGTKVTEKDIMTGLTGDGGLVEILSGVNEGEQVITFTKTNVKTTTGK